MNNVLEIKNVEKIYNTKEGEIKALDKINLNIPNGKIIAFVGPSGCGKSTLLSLISELDTDYTGIIKKDKNIQISYMLQSDALLPWLTIYENSILGLKIQNKLTDDNLKYVDYLLKLYNLYEFKDNYPKSLSGGMKQRVALIRTLAINPDLLLLDEPFCALDEYSRLIISNDLYNIIKNDNKTAILVTHNIEEAISFADTIVIFSKRPATIKKIINTKINNIENIYEKRKDENFHKLYDIIWKELDVYECKSN